MTDNKAQTTKADNDLNEQQASVLTAATHNLTTVIDQLASINIPKLDECTEALDNVKAKLEKLNG